VKTIGALALSLATLLLARGAAAAVPLCLEVTAPPEDLPSFRKLVRSEVDRHPSHRVAESDCRSHLRVELFEAAGTRFLTAQIDREIPARFIIKDPIDLAPRVEDALRITLHNDPSYLIEDLEHLNALQRFGQAILVHGRTRFRLELFDAVSRSGTGPVTVPGLALGVTRGSGNLQVLGRLYGGGVPGETAGTDQALQAMAGVDGGITVELFPNKANWSPYVSGCGGVQFVRYAGHEHAGDASLTYVNDVGATLSARVGVRFFRGYDFDLDIFTQGYVPLFVTKDVDSGFFGGAGLYTPSVQVGLGVGF
jgi:hypothetical protein